jgi:RNA polymerase sigma-70 factor (ECF subfamily)
MMGEPTSGSRSNTLDDATDGRRLLGRVAEGDREAFHAFYDRYGARVMAMVRRRIAVSTLASELVQDVFVAVWLGASSYREQSGDPERWLLGITHHKLQDHWRRLMQERAKADGGHVGCGACDSRIPDADDRLTVEEALGRLPVDQRRVLDLIYRGGLTFAETAHALRMPVGTVKSRVHTALSALRAFFSPTGGA